MCSCVYVYVHVCSCMYVYAHVCALAGQGFSSDDKRPVFLMSTSYFSKLTGTTDEDVKNDACNEEDEYKKASDADKAACKEAWQCDVGKVKKMLEGSFYIGSNQVREELREGESPQVAAFPLLIRGGYFPFPFSV